MLTKTETMVVKYVHQLLQKIEEDTNIERQTRAQEVLEECGQIFHQLITAKATVLHRNLLLVQLKKDPTFDTNRLPEIDYLQYKWEQNVRKDAREARIKWDMLRTEYKVGKIADMAGISDTDFAHTYSAAVLYYAVEKEVEKNTVRSNCYISELYKSFKESDEVATLLNNNTIETVDKEK